MEIGIIGSGQIGGTLTRRLSELGHQVSVANSRGPASLADLAAETGAKPVTVEEAARARDIVIVANTLMTCPNIDPDCANARNGIGPRLNNNDFNMVYVDADSSAAKMISAPPARP